MVYVVDGKHGYTNHGWVHVKARDKLEGLGRQHLPFPCANYGCGRVVWRHPASFPSLCWPCWDKAREESIANVAAAIHYIQATYGDVPESG